MEAIGWQRQRNHYYRTGQNRCSNIIAGQEACKQITGTCSRQQQHVNTVFWRLYPVHSGHGRQFGFGWRVSGEKRGGKKCMSQAWSTSRSFVHIITQAGKKKKTLLNVFSCSLLLDHASKQTILAMVGLFEESQYETDRLNMIDNINIESAFQ